MKVADEFEQQVDDAAKLVGTLLEEVGLCVHLKFYSIRLVLFSILF